MQAIITETAPRRHPVGSLFKPIESGDVTVEQVTRAVQGLRGAQLQEVLALTCVLKNDRGCASPAENLIRNLLSAYGSFGGCLMLKDVENRMEDFRDEWNSITEQAETLPRQYPHLFSTGRQDNAMDGAAKATSDGSTAKAGENVMAMDEDLRPKPPAAADPGTLKKQRLESATLRLAMETLDECISRIADEKSDLPRVYEQGLQDFNGHLADALLLREILMDWNSRCREDKFPHDTDLVASIRGNLNL